MNASMRAILLWVMVFAMPVQGMAASLMAFCGPSHERMMQGVGPEHFGHHVAQGHGHGEPAPTSAQDAPQIGEEVTHDATPQDSSGVLARLGQFSCSACAVCCSVMGFPAHWSLPRSPESAHALPSVLTISVQSHLPDGLDRPPRVSLA